MSRYSLLIVSAAALFTVGCAPSSSVYHWINPWSSDFETAVDRCSTIRESRDRTGCEKMMNTRIAMERDQGKSFCYAVNQRVVCKTRPQALYNSANAIYSGADKQTYGR